MSGSPQQITRREILKRGAIVGGSVLWVTPVVQTLGMGRALAQTPSDVCVDTGAGSVVYYTRGIQRGTLPSIPNGPLVLDHRAVASNILGDTAAFVSLGYNGEIVVQLSLPYFSGKGGSALVVETTFAAPNDPVERAEVYVADNAGGPWYRLGLPPTPLADSYADNKVAPQTETTFSLDPFIPAAPYVVRFVKLVDDTDPLPHSVDSDGFDATKVLIRCLG